MAMTLLLWGSDFPPCSRPDSCERYGITALIVQHDQPVAEVLDVLDVGGALEAGNTHPVVAGGAEEVGGPGVHAARVRKRAPSRSRTGAPVLEPGGFAAAAVGKRRCAHAAAGGLVASLLAPGGQLTSLVAPSGPGALRAASRPGLARASEVVKW